MYLLHLCYISLPIFLDGPGVMQSDGYTHHQYDDMLLSLLTLSVCSWNRVPERSESVEAADP